MTASPKMPELLPCKNCKSESHNFAADGDVTCSTGHCYYNEAWYNPEDWNLVMAPPAPSTPTTEENSRDKMWCAALLNCVTIDKTAEIISKCLEYRANPEAYKALAIPPEIEAILRPSTPESVGEKLSAEELEAIQYALFIISDRRKRRHCPPAYMPDSEFLVKETKHFNTLESLARHMQGKEGV